MVLTTMLTNGTGTFQPARPANNGNNNIIIEEVPSAVYQFSRWYELQGGEEIRGSDLHSPRIREGPVNVTSAYASHMMMYCKKGGDWRDFRNRAEDWENAETVNLSYQDLGDAYQKSELMRCLSRLVNCTHLQLMHNGLSDLSKVCLPRCKRLNLSRNRFSSIKKLPSAPQLQHLSLTDNQFSSVPQLSSKYPNLTSLHFRGNPTEFGVRGYRFKMFQTIPSLEYLDNYPRLPSDAPLLSHTDSNSSTFSTHSTNSTQSSKCTIS